MTGRTPRTVLVDLETWDSLGSWGAALHQRGWQVHRVVLERHGLRRLARAARDRAVFGGPSIEVPSSPAALTLTAELAATVRAADDIQGTETTVSTIREAGLLSPGTLRGRAPDLERQECLYDKWLMNERARGLGLGVPESWSSPPPGLLPLVVKGRIGAGGQAVVIAHDQPQLEQAIAALTQDQGQPPFFQELMPGVVVNAAGVAQDGRLLVHALYEAQAPADDPLGPPEVLRIGDYPQIAEELAHLLADLRYTGIFCVDYLFSDDGRVGLLDFNPRVFGGWLALQAAGVDLLGAYLSLVDSTIRPTGSGPPAGTMLHDRILPADTAASRDELLPELRRSIAAVRTIRPLTGSAYAAMQLVRAGRVTLGAAATLRQAQEPTNPD